MAEYTVAGADTKDRDSRQNFYFLVSGNRIIYQSKTDRNPLSDEMKLVNSENGKPTTNKNITFYEFVSGKTLNKLEGKTNEKGTFKFPATASKEYYRTYLIQQPETNDFRSCRYTEIQYMMPIITPTGRPFHGTDFYRQSHLPSGADCLL